MEYVNNTCNIKYVTLFAKQKVEVPQTIIISNFYGLPLVFWKKLQNHYYTIINYHLSTAL